jgi:hypothetical protein
MQIRGRRVRDAIDAGEGSRFSAARDGLWTAQDRARTGARRAFGWLSWEARQLLWSLRDRAELAGPAARALGAAVLVLIAAGVGVAALLWAAPDHGKRQTPVAAVAAPRPVPRSRKPAKPPAPTLHGAAPVFESAGGHGAAGDGSTECATTASSANPTGSAGAAGSGSAAAAGDEAATTKISSEPASGSSSSPAAASSARSGTTRPARGPVAGPAAVAVANRFAAAFVGYEVGEAEDPRVQAALEATTTPQLGQALLERPPRLPANVKVPKAKVLNVVPAPSRDHVFPISVSLLRVGTTSELRLEMQKLKGKGWLVTNVLG